MKNKLALLYENPELKAIAHYAMDEESQFIFKPGAESCSIGDDTLIFESTSEMFRTECFEHSYFTNYLLTRQPLSVKVASNFKYKSKSNSAKKNVIDSSIEQIIELHPGFATVVGNSPQIAKVKQELFFVSEKNCKVLLQGESGTGKSMLAKILHEVSARKNEKYISVNVAAMPKDLIESTLFGTVRGAYTDARDKKGLIPLAEHGTIFLDEIGEMPLSCQTKLLHTLDDGCFRKVGSELEEKTDARFIFATNANLKQMVKEKLFREDLYWRIAEFVIRVPSLQSREEDIIPLADYFLTSQNKKENTNYYFSEEAKEKLLEHSWPGNIRELKSCINIALIFAKSEKISANDIHFEI